MNRYELKFPLKHPNYVMQDSNYIKDVDAILGRSDALSRLIVKAEDRYRRIMFGNTMDKINRKLKRLNKKTYALIKISKITYVERAYE